MKVSGESGATAVMTTGSMSKAGACWARAAERWRPGPWPAPGRGKFETRVLHDGASLSLHVGRRARADAARAGRGPGMRRKAAKGRRRVRRPEKRAGARGSCDQARDRDRRGARPQRRAGREQRRQGQRRRRRDRGHGGGGQGRQMGQRRQVQGLVRHHPERAFLGGVIGLAGVSASRGSDIADMSDMAGDGARVHQRRHHAGRTAGGRAEADLQAALAQRGGVRHVTRPAPARAARSPRRAGTAGSVRAIPWRGVTADWTCVAFYLIRALIRARGRRSRAARLRCIMAHARRCAARYSHANARGVRPAGRPAA